MARASTTSTWLLRDGVRPISPGWPRHPSGMRSPAATQAGGPCPRWMWRQSVGGRLANFSDASGNWFGRGEDLLPLLGKLRGTVVVRDTVRHQHGVPEAQGLLRREGELLAEERRRADGGEVLRADEPLRRVARVVGVVDEDQAGSAVDLVVLAGEAHPGGSLTAEFVASAALGCEHGSAGE